MLQKFKTAIYALIVGLVLVSHSSAQTGIPDATSCKGWNCSIEGQICPQGVPGASAGDFICTNSKWVQMLDVPAQKPVDNIAKATSCRGFKCDIEGQICPQGVPGASSGDFICTNSKWVQSSVYHAPPATSCRGDKCDIACQICPQGVPGASSGSHICRNSTWQPIHEDYEKLTSGWLSGKVKFNLDAFDPTANSHCDYNREHN